MVKMDRQDEVRKITEKLESAVVELVSSDRYKDWLVTMSKFHSYSLNNTILILCQKPDAKRVAGYKTWQSLGRQVRKGEKSIRILAPCPFKKTIKDDDGEEKVVMIPRYRVVGVFDISQTDGPDLPTIYNGPLKDGVDGYEKLLGDLLSICPVHVSFDDIEGGANGFFSPGENRICVKKGMSEAQTIKTLIHEMAHQMLHGGKCLKDRETKEVEAESVAYTVCNWLGIETDDYSLSYVAGWSSGKDLKELRGSMEAIRVASKEMIDRLEKKSESKAA